MAYDKQERPDRKEEIRKMLALIRLEIFKLRRQAKTYIALIALNALPIISFIISLLVVFRLKTYHLENLIPYDSIQEIYKFLLLCHLKALNWLMPFFLVMLIADMISGELARGTIKTLILRPVTRSQVLTAKIITVMLFLMLTVFFGAFILQCNLVFLKWTILRPEYIKDLVQDAGIIPFDALVELFFVAFCVNLTVVCFCAMISVFTHSSTLSMALTILILLIFYSWAILDPIIAAIFDKFYLGGYTQLSKYLFTYSIERLTDLEFLDTVLKVSKPGSYVPAEIPMKRHLAVLAAYTCGFVFFCYYYFNRRDILS
ncbi:ABC transporter permease [Candidatus Riflebacteria bacterium]